MFRLINKMVIGLLTSIVNAYNHTKCIFLNNQQCMTQPSLIKIHRMNALKDYVTIHL